MSCFVAAVKFNLAFRSSGRFARAFCHRSVEGVFEAMIAVSLLDLLDPYLENEQAGGILGLEMINDRASSPTASLPTASR